MLTGLRIRNFKSIGDPGVDLELKPLTVLVGPNGSGKSSILEGLALVAQSIGNRIAPTGSLVSYAALQEIAHGREGARWVRLGLSSASECYEYGFRLETDEFVQSIGAHGRCLAEARLELVARQEGSRSYQRKLGIAPDGPYEVVSNIEPERVLSPAAFAYTGSSTNLDGYRNELRQAADLVRSLAGQLGGKVRFLRALRGIELGPTDGEDLPDWVGPHGRHTLHILNQLNKGKHRKKKAAVERWSERFGIKLPAAYASPLLDADYDDPELGVNLPLRLASYGGAQALTIVVQIFWDDPGCILLLEEPEISLHLQGQVDMAELLSSAATQGKQIIATTHSTFFLLGLGEAVRAEIIDPGSIVVYELAKGRQGTALRKRYDLSDNGELDGWIQSFSAVERRLLRSWSKTLAEV